jgi:hypothetical protein
MVKNGDEVAAVMVHESNDAPDRSRPWQVEGDI